jgi:hypothetical protein
MPYQGYAPDGGTVDIVPASIGATEMWRRYIQPRRPVVLNGLLDDAAWHGDKWVRRLYRTADARRISRTYAKQQVMQRY